MRSHAHVKIDATASNHYISSISSAEQQSPRAATSAWARLVRVQQALLAAVEADLKRRLPAACLVRRAAGTFTRSDGKLRPLDLEKAMLLPQYGMSRLIDRMVRAAW